MQQIPKIDEKVAADLLKLSQEKALAVSGGKLRVFESGSPVSAILEATAVASSEVITQVNTLASSLEEKRLSYFGLIRFDGSPASGVVAVTLAGLYPDNFVLPAGFRFTSEGVAFTITSDIIITPYQTIGSAIAIALNVGVASNIKKTSAIEFEPIDRVASLTWLEDPSGGANPETDEEWRERIYQTLQRRDTLISEDDFEDEIRLYLGKGSVALAIGRLKPDKTTYGNGYVAVFGLNPDGTTLGTAQISDLGQKLNRKAAMALISVWSIEIVPVNVDAVASIEESTNPYTAITAIKNVIESYIYPGRLPIGETILNKAVERRIQAVDGVKEGLVSVRLNNLSQPVPLPNLWSAAKANVVKIVVIRNGVEFS